MIGRRSLLLSSLAIALSCGSLAADDLRVQLNPALGRVHAADPERAEAILDALDAIVRGRSDLLPPAHKTRGHLDERSLKELLDRNPLVQEAWRIDPKAALTQIKEIVAIGGN